VSDISLPLGLSIIIGFIVALGFYALSLMRRGVGIKS